jgi:DNA-binding LacI/PurR family transcriptional regulator
VPVKHRGQPPTQADVARLAGVSQATVSAVVNGLAPRSRIPDETAQRVLAAVQELGYVANMAARSLKGKRNQLLGVHTFESVFPISSRDFYHEFLIGIEEQAVAEGYDLVLFTSTEQADGSRAIYHRGVNRLNVADGSVLLGLAHDSSELARLAGEGYPFVHVGRRSVPGVDFPWGGADYAAATGQVVAHLVQLGHRRVAYLGVDGHMEALVDRETGYRTACQAAGIPSLPLRMDAPDLTLDWFDLAMANGVTAFVAEDDSFGPRLAEFARSREREIPRDLSVVILRDAADGPYPHRPWSSLGVPRNEMGRSAVQLLIRILTEPEPPPDHHLWLACAAPSDSTIATAPITTAPGGAA